MDIAESLFGAMSIVVDEKIKHLDYDKTIICTVVDDSDAKNNIYIVSDGNVQFKAKGDNDLYKKDDSVYVLILEGDMSKEKTIQGKHQADGAAKPITYVSPLDSVVKITDNLFSEDISRGIYGINVEDSTTEQLVGEVVFSDENSIINKDLYKTVYIKAEFQTNFDGYDIREGDYGLRIRLISSRDNEEGKYNSHYFDFDAKQHMFGNLYAFKIFTSQEMKFMLSDWPENLVGLQVWLYQRNNFKYVNNKGEFSTFTKDSEQIAGLDNIRVKNIEVGFGVEIDSQDNYSVKLYTNEALSYNSNDLYADIRKLRLLWYNRSEDGKYIGFSDGVYYGKDDNGNYTYDEDQYIKETEADQRLLAQIRKNYYASEQGLTCAANCQDLEKAIQRASIIIRRESNELLQGLKAYTYAMDWEDGHPCSNVLSKLGDWGNALDEAREDIINAYDEILKIPTEGETISYLDEETAEALFTDVQNQLFSTDTTAVCFYNNIDNIFTKIETKIQNGYSTYQNTYDTYKRRWESIKQELSGLVQAEDGTGLVETIKNSDLVYLTGNEPLTGDDYTSTIEQKKEQYDNRYCIYWYRYNPAAATIDPHKGQGWERLPQFTNHCIPFDEGTETVLTKNNDCVAVSLGAVQQEKYAVVLFHNHKKIESNEVVFTNSAVIPDNSMINRLGALSIQHCENTHSQDSYQLYGPTGQLVNAGEAQYTRKLKAHFESEDGGDEQLIGATIYWYVPNNATMLDVFSSDIQSKFSTDTVIIYEDLEKYDRDYRRGKIYDYRTYLIGPNSTGEKITYNMVTLNPQFKELEKTYSTSQSLPLDYDQQYLWPAAPGEINNYVAQKWDSGTGKWITIEEVDKYLLSTTPANYYTEAEWSDPSGDDKDSSKTYLVGPINNLYYYYGYNEEDEQWEPTGLTITDLTRAAIDATIYRPGYSCYYKKIDGTTTESEEIIVKEDDLIFPYHVKPYYQPTATQNTILCVVEKDGLIFNTSKYFSFSSYGSNGTDYTLALIPNPEYPMITPEDELFVSIDLYDHTNEKVALKYNDEKVKVNWTFGGVPDNSGIQFDNKNFVTGCLIGSSAISFGGILKCSLDNVEINDGRTVDLSAEISIPWALSRETYIDGPVMIVYDSLGTNPQYYQKEYALYGKSTNAKKNEITWTLKYYHKNGNELTEEELNDKEKNYLFGLPTLKDDRLVPAPMYISYQNEDDRIFPVIVATSGEERIVWAQPIVIMQNTYGSSVLNAWDGSLQIDDTNNTILSAMMGAGIKNSDNTFSGVLMGDVGVRSEDNNIHTIGLYGFHGSAQSFGFKVDGTAFLGKSSGGRILFNGNEGIIYSANWLDGLKGGPLFVDGNLNPSEQGMAIDLQNGHIDAYNFKLTSNGIQLNSSPNIESGEKYIEIGKNDTGKLTYDGSIFDLSAFAPTVDNPNERKSLLYIGNDNYFLQSKNYAPEDDEGMRIDLDDGHIDAYDFKLTSGLFSLSNEHLAPLNSESALKTWYNSTSIDATKGSIIFKAGDNFAITQNGYLFAKAGTIGSITIGNLAEKHNPNLLIGTDNITHWSYEEHESNNIKPASGDNDSGFYAGVLDETNPKPTCLYFKHATVEKNKKYTLSFKMKYDKEIIDGQNIVQVMLLSGEKNEVIAAFDDGWSEALYATEFIRPETNDFVLYKLTFTVRNDLEGNLNNCVIRFTGNPSPSGTYSEYADSLVYVKELKLEEGPSATQWSVPALLSDVNTNDFSWSFSPTDGMFMWNGTQGNGSNEDPNLVLKVWKNTTNNKKELFIKGHIESESGNIGALKIDEYGFYTEDLEIRKNKVLFKSGIFSLQDEVLIYYDENDNTAYIESDGTKDFILKNEGGAGIKFTSRNNTSTSTFKVELEVKYSGTHEFSPGSSYVPSWHYDPSAFLYYNCGSSVLMSPKNLKIKVRDKTFSVTIPARISSGSIELGEICPEEPTWPDRINRDYTGINAEFSYTEDTISPSPSYSAVATKHELTISDYSGTNKTMYSLGHIYPNSTDCFLGADIDGCRWGGIALSSYPIINSDRRNKKNIMYDLETYESFFNELRPANFEYKLFPGKIRFGFIAQDVISSLYTTSTSAEKHAIVSNINEAKGSSCSLCYEEFISLNTWQIQKLKPRMSEAEERIYKLEQELAELKSKLI